jgi:hypothetical protein
MTSPYAPDTATQRRIIEQDLRLCHNTLAQLEYQLKVERRIASVVGEASAQQITAIEQALRVMAARIEAYQELLAELPAEAALTNGVHG